MVPETLRGRGAAATVPCALAFVASFAIMVVELVAGRLIARHVGFSLYTWTSVIGVVLGGIMCGNVVGGRLADRFAPRRAVALLFLLAAGACFAIPALDFQIGQRDLLAGIQSWPLRIAAHVMLVFFAPATALGLIGPVVAKMALDGAAHTGRTVGHVYGWGAFGSIVGTFAAGFYLIGHFGTIAIVVGVGGGLAVVGLLLGVRRAVAPALVLLLVFGPVYARGPWLWSWNGGWVKARVPCTNCLWTDESDYSYVQITDEADGGYRELTLDNLVHAYYAPGGGDGFHYAYERIYATATARFAGSRVPLRTFFIGGGGYTFPRAVLKIYPGSVVDVAEIDPMVTTASAAAFGLDPDLVRVQHPGDPSAGGALDVFHMDARNAVDDLLRAREAGRLEPFDVVYGDAFNHYSVPFHLVTREFTEKVKEILRPDTGIYLINVVDILREGRFLGAVCATFQSVFPFVYAVTSEQPSGDDSSRDTVVVIGAQRELDMGDFGRRLGDTPITGTLLDAAAIDALETRAGHLVLTDDFSPVENLLDVVVRRAGLPEVKAVNHGG